MERPGMHQVPLGYQVNCPTKDLITLSEQERLLTGGHLHINIGDPFTSQCKLANTNQYECAVIQDVGACLGLAPDSSWGYILPGSSLGNLQGMWTGRECLPPDCTFITSAAAHVSVRKNAHLLGLRKVEIIPSTPSGQIDLAAFEQAVAKASSCLVVLTLGTTMTCAYDDVAACCAILEARFGPQAAVAQAQDLQAESKSSGPFSELGVQVQQQSSSGAAKWLGMNGAPAALGAAGSSSISDTKCPATSPSISTSSSASSITALDLDQPPEQQQQLLKYYIHVDGALGGFILPFLRSGTYTTASAANSVTTSTCGSALDQATSKSCAAAVAAPPPATVSDFRLPGVCSITMSLHKQIGLDTPSAIFLCRSHLRPPAQLTEYICSADPTLLCSRDGSMAVKAWLRMQQLGIQGISCLAERAVARTQQLVQDLQLVGFPAWCNPAGVCVVFPSDALPQAVAARFEVVSEGPISHVYVMDSVSDQLLQQFVEYASSSSQGK